MGHTGRVHPALFYLPGRRLTQTELSAARLDGVVVELGEGYIPADLVENAATRAASLGPLIPRGLAASGPSAAWIHGAGDAAPAPHHARRASVLRVRAPQDARLVVHDTRLPEADVLRIGGVEVTTPPRTMVDLALGAHRDASFHEWLVALDEIVPELAANALDAVRSLNRVPGTREAVRLLERILAARTT